MIMAVMINRTMFTNCQQDALEVIFKDNHYPDNQQRETLSLKTGLPEDRIQVLAGRGFIGEGGIIKRASLRGHH